MSYLKKYEYVIAVCNHGGISQAAQSLGISQPTFSKYLKKLEEELGVELFDRSTLPIRLTRAGERFVDAGKRFIDMERQLKKELEEIKSGVNSVVKIGISPSRSPYMMPEIISAFKKRRTNSKIIIEEKTTHELSKRLREGELDLIISLLDEETSGFERIELFDESILLAVSNENAKESVSETLLSSDLISVGKGQAMWQTLNSISRELSISEPEIECQSIESALALVKQGIGAMLVPSYIARGKSDSIKFLPLPKEKGEVKRKVCLFYRKEQFLTKAEHELIECIVNIEKKER